KWKQVKWDRGVIEMIGKHDRLITIEIDDVVRGILTPLKGNHPVYVFTRVAQRTMDFHVEYRRRDGTTTKKHFSDVKGEHYPWNRDSLRGAWDTLRNTIGLDARWHDFRHDFASKALRTSSDAATIKAVSES